MKKRTIGFERLWQCSVQLHFKSVCSQIILLTAVFWKCIKVSKHNDSQKGGKTAFLKQYNLAKLPYEETWYLSSLAWGCWRQEALVAAMLPFPWAGRPCKQQLFGFCFLLLVLCVTNSTYHFTLLYGHCFSCFSWSLKGGRGSWELSLLFLIQATWLQAGCWLRWGEAKSIKEECGQDRRS